MPFDSFFALEFAKNIKGIANGPNKHPARTQY
jgi:hypothetical protein